VLVLESASDVDWLNGGLTVLRGDWGPPAQGHRHDRAGCGPQSTDAACSPTTFVLTDPLPFGRELTAEDMWANSEHFAKAILPAAEEAGVRTALHSTISRVKRSAG
jgi:hypothetical protein